MEVFQSTRPVRGATMIHFAWDNPRDVSIHAPRAGRDFYPSCMGDVDTGFNPRAPCGARQAVYLGGNDEMAFQSTRPVRGATLICWIDVMIHLFQSTRPVRGATSRSAEECHFGEVSIHAPRAGRDIASCGQSNLAIRFNPRAPCGARQVLTKTGMLLSSFQSTRPVRGATTSSMI